MGLVFRLLALGGALALTWYSIDTPAESTWRMALGAVAVLLTLLLWPRRRPVERALGHNVRILAVLFVVPMILLGLQLLRLQIAQAPAIRERIADLPEGAVENIRPMLAERRTRRGAIYDRDGVLLADIEITADGWVRRTYPRADLGHIVGFYNPLYGNAGLEATYDDYLAGRVDVDEWTRFVEGLLHLPHSGYDLHLTLDVALQEAAQEALGEQNGAIVLLDPRSGAILAMAAHPRFDPRPMVFDPTAADWEEERERIAAYWNALGQDERALLLNRATSGLYTPGSTFKTLTAAAALESGVATIDTVITCPNELEVTGHTVVNALEDLAERYMEREDLLEVYQYSCNTAFAQLGLAMGADLYSEYGRRFGLTYGDMAWLMEPALADLPSAVSTMAHTRSFLDRPTALADTAYGQGELQITPLRLAMIAATIANEGMMMRPYLVEQAVDGAGGVHYQADPSPLSVPIGIRTSETMTEMMIAAIEDGWGWRAMIEGVTVAGKTGTAETGSGEPHAVFIAFAPAEAPRLAIAVVVEQGGSASTVAAPIARTVLEAALAEE